MKPKDKPLKMKRMEQFKSGAEKRRAEQQEERKGPKMKRANWVEIDISKEPGKSEVLRVLQNPETIQLCELVTEDGKVREMFLSSMTCYSRVDGKWAIHIWED